jgi:glutamate decarboxylase
LIDSKKPSDLVARLKFLLPEEGLGKDGLLQGIERLLKYSVNTWDQGFMDKLYASNTPVCANIVKMTCEFEVDRQLC